MEYSLRNSEALKFMPFNLVSSIRNYYLHYDIKYIQFNKESAVFDSRLLYKLKPGKFSFSNREFENEFNVNGFGVRDDTESLEGPEIVVLGDSQAMGWGVEQSQTFSELLQKKSGKKVLNAAIASYGTPRELMILNDLDKSKAKTIVLQYSQNDFNENKYYCELEGNSVVRTKEDWEYWIADRFKSAYHPGKHLLNLFFSAFKFFDKDKDSNKSAIDTLISSKAEVDFFLCIFKKFKPDFENPVDLYILQAYHWIDTPESFIESLKKRKLELLNLGIFKSVNILDLDTVLNDEDFWILDGHFNESGHGKIAEILFGVISGSK